MWTARRKGLRFIRTQFPEASSRMSVFVDGSEGRTCLREISKKIDIS